MLSLFSLKSVGEKEKEPTNSVAFTFRLLSGFAQRLNAMSASTFLPEAKLVSLTCKLQVFD